MIINSYDTFISTFSHHAIAHLPKTRVLIPRPHVYQGFDFNALNSIQVAIIHFQSCYGYPSYRYYSSLKQLKSSKCDTEARYNSKFKNTLF